MADHSPVNLQILPGKYFWNKTRYLVLDDIVHPSGKRVPSGFITDGASVPKALTPLGLFLFALSALLNSPFLFALASLAVLIPYVFPRLGRSARAAIFHDYQLESGVPRHIADWLFLRELKASGIPRWQCWPMFVAVRLWGLRPW